MASEGATAQAIYDFIIKKFTDRGIPLENIIGFASDGCNVMMGSQNSVASRFQENLPDSKLVELDERIRVTYTELLMCYMQRDHVQQSNISSIVPDDTRYFLPQMYLGVKIMMETQKPGIAVKKEELKEFYSRCRDFLVTGCKEIKKRYDFSDDLLQLLKYLSPEEAVSNETRNVCPSILPLLQKLPRIVNNAEEFQKIDDEWRMLPVVNKLSLYEINLQKTDEFWLKIRDGTNLKALASFALNVLCLPHSNADCERIFSEVNNIKTRLRNQLITPTINGALLAKQAIRNNNNCTQFQVPNEMIHKMKNKNLNTPEAEVLENLQNLYGEE
ncbi:hypothetical protein ACJJTC_009646 [Scirpophaga incertulas]